MFRLLCLRAIGAVVAEPVVARRQLDALHDREAQLESIERSDKRPIVHWLSDQNSTEGVLVGTKDDTVFRIEGRMERHKHPTGTIVQLERVGYARVMEDGSFMLCHEELQDE